MSRRRRSSVRVELSRLVVLALVLVAALAVSKNWLGAQDAYTAASEWLGRQVADRVAEAAKPDLEPPPAPAPAR